jgi:predicted AAA+ superfamily ATPase
MTLYDLNRPWLSLDPWQEEYIKTPAEQDCFLLTTRQAGKTTSMSIKSVEMCLREFRKGDAVLIASLTEKQGYLMLAKALAYAMEKYPESIKKRKD